MIGRLFSWAQATFFPPDVPEPAPAPAPARPQTTWKPAASPDFGIPMVEELRRAKLDGYYVPDLEDVYVKWDDFRYPRWFVYEAH